MSLLIVSMSTTSVNVALPAIGADFDAPIAGLQWIIDAYVVVLAGLLLLSGSLADRIGRRRTFQIGLVVFACGSLMCSLAPTLEWLIGFRMVQALGGSMLNPVAISIITNVFTDSAERAKAIGIWGGVSGLGLGIGPLLGGALVEFVDWRAVFWINLPIGVCTVVAAALFLPEFRPARARGFDVIGQLAMLAFLGSSIYAIIEAPHAGWLSVQTLCLAAGAAASLGVLLLHERRCAEPLFDVRFFRSVPFAGAAVIAVLAYAAISGFLFLNMLYLQNVRGLGPLEAGLCVLPLAAMVLVCSPISGRIVARHGTRPPLMLAGAMLCAGGLLMSWFEADTALAWVLMGYVVFGAGQGMVNAPITTTAVSGMPRSRAGVAAAVATTSRQVGTALGVAIVGSVVSSRSTGELESSLISASQLGLWIIAGCGGTVCLVGALSTTKWARRTSAGLEELLLEDGHASVRGAH